MKIKENTAGQGLETIVDLSENRNFDNLTMAEVEIQESPKVLRERAQRTTFADRINDAYILFTGNRFTLAGNTLMGSSIYNAVSSFANEKPLYALLSIPMLFAGLALSYYTRFGSSTLTFYRRTKEHIRKNGYFKPRVAEKWIRYVSEDPIHGYCELQGIYLAAKECSQLETFEETRRRFSKVKIPHC